MSDTAPIHADAPYPVPANECARGHVIAELDLPRRADDPFFAHVVDLARRIFDAPVAFISLISGEEQRFLRIDGMDLEGTPRTHSMCAYTVAARQTIVSGDTHDDPRFRDHPIVAGPPHVRFSASAPVILSSGFCLGTVCAVDLVPHDPPTPSQIAQLDALAGMVARFYEVPLEPDPAHAHRLRAIASEAQDAFLDLIGHELRTPLNGIMGLAECLSPTDPGEAEIVAALKGSTEHLGAIVESILSFTELRSGDVALNEAPARIDMLVTRAVDRMRRLAAARGTSVVLHLPDSEARPLIDAAKLELAITCLLDNVLAHGGGQAVVTVTTDPSAGIQITVQDDGAGIPDAQQARIWSAFAVGADLHTRATDGLGLGLPLAHRIAELHGGTLTLQPATTGISVVMTLPGWRMAA
ncbi:ATP-binding protein [Jannaschia sp. KMU-145]|uniref:GAF domain-containing sensor histidine kinase n=1 Tax=Jannaschia halovivens TaxID=3388667 RepID=UPI00396AF94A